MSHNSWVIVYLVWLICFPWFINSKNNFNFNRLWIWSFNVDRLFYSSHNFRSAEPDFNQAFTDGRYQFDCLYFNKCPWIFDFSNSMYLCERICCANKKEMKSAIDHGWAKIIKIKKGSKINLFGHIQTVTDIY